VLAGFYDAGGGLLDTGRFVHRSTVHNDEAGTSPNETEHFAIKAVRHFRARAVSAAVGVPVLDDELLATQTRRGGSRRLH
jgi:hypothetical protein